MNHFDFHIAADCSCGVRTGVRTMVRQLAGLMPGLVSGLVLLLAAMTVHAEKTISYYSDNVGERIDRVLACRDGAEDPRSLGCQNARGSNDLDRILAGRFADHMAIAQMRASNGETQDAKARAYKVLKKVHDSGRGGACVALTKGVEPSRPVVKQVLKTAMDEKLIEAVAGKPNVYRSTPRGDEFLTAQGDGTERGYFCPYNLQFAPDPKLLELQDLSDRYKGKKNGTGKVVRTLRVNKIAFELTNTAASVWFVRKIFPGAFPMKGHVVAQIVTVEYEGAPDEFYAGGAYEIDGQLAGNLTVDKFLEAFK